MTAVTAFSTGPFGIADNVAMTHLPNVRATCMADGTLLGPTRPLMAIDASYARDLSVAVQDHFHNGNVWNSASDIATADGADGGRMSYMSYFYVLEFGLVKQFRLQRLDLHSGRADGRPQSRGLVPGRDYAHLIWDDGGTFAPSMAGRYTAGRWQAAAQPVWSGADVHATVTIGAATLPPAGVYPNGTLASSLHGFLPIVHGFCLLGELGKFVAVSPVRFSQLRVSDSELEVQVAGAPGEEVRVSVSVHGVAKEHVVPVGPSGKAALRVPKA